MADRETKIDNTQILDETITENELNASVAGLGLSGGAGAPLAFTPSGLASIGVDVGADSFIFLDASDSNLPKTDSLANLMTAIAGTGIDATAGVLSINEGEIDHDALLNFIANEHIDWTVDQGGSPIIHPNNVIPELISNNGQDTSVTCEVSTEITMEVLGTQYFIMNSNGDTAIFPNASSVSGTQLFVSTGSHDGNTFQYGAFISNETNSGSNKVEQQYGLNVRLLDLSSGAIQNVHRAQQIHLLRQGGDSNSDTISLLINQDVYSGVDLSDLYGIKIELQLGNILGAGSIDTYYALHISDTTGDTPTNLTAYYGIYQEVISAVNYFAGGIVIGGDTPSTADIALDNDGTAVFNNQENAVDFRIAGDTITSLFFVDGSEDRIGIGTNSPNEIFHVNGNFRLSEASASHEYNITLREVVGLTSVAWQNQSSGTESAFEMYTKDGDATDGCLFRFFAIGIPTDITPGNYFEMGYVVGAGYVVRSQHLSSVSLPVSIGTVEGLHLTVNTTGEIDILNGELDMNDNSVGFIEQVKTIPSGGSVDIDWKRGNKASIELTENVTFTFTDPSRVGNFILKVSQASGSNFTITWPSNVLWPRGITPSLTIGESTDIIAFYFDGTSYYGVMTSNFS